MAVQIVVAGALIRDGMLLVAQRDRPPELAGRWELPGGKVEPGESWRQALHREIDEELDVRVRLGRFVTGPLPDGRWQLSPRHVIAVWLAQIVDGVPVPREEHDALRWLPREELAALPWLGGDRPIIEAIAARWPGGAGGQDARRSARA